MLSVDIKSTSTAAREGVPDEGCTLRASLGLLLPTRLDVFVFHRGGDRRVNEWAAAAMAPVVVLVSASMSLATWTGVVFAGRFLAYIRFADTAARHRATSLAVIEKYLWLAKPVAYRRPLDSLVVGRHHGPQRPSQRAQHRQNDYR